MNQSNYHWTICGVYDEPVLLSLENTCCL